MWDYSLLSKDDFSVGREGGRTDPLLLESCERMEVGKRNHRENDSCHKAGLRPRLNRRYPLGLGRDFTIDKKEQ